jgi:small subunit ribosomal protein S15
MASWVWPQSVAASTDIPPANRPERVQHGPITQGALTVALSTEEKKAILAEYGLHDTDTGSPEAKAALLSRRISGLTDHLKEHKHDHHTRRGLMGLVGRRRRLLRHLQQVDIERYRSLIERLGLRR